MGYYTKYELEIVSGPETVTRENECETCGATNERKFTLHSELARECEGWDYARVESGKWYTHEEDMKAFSRKHPDTVFKLSGEGEEVGDIWVKYFKNGKMQADKLVVSLALFDESRLK